MRKIFSYSLALALVAGFAVDSLAAKTTPAPKTKAPVSTPKPKASSPAVAATPAISTPELVEPLEQSEANWSVGSVRTTGIGLAPERGSLSQRRTMARREAYVDAYQGLSDAIEQIRVTGDATVRDYLVADESLKAKIDNMIKDSQVGEGKLLSDGSVEVSLTMPLFGEKGLSSILLDTPVSALASGSAGLIVDARGSGAQPALAPQIKNSGGKVLIDIPGVRYFHTIEAAKAALGSPTVVKARLSGGATRANIILDETNAKQVKSGLGRGDIIIIL